MEPYAVIQNGGRQYLVHKGDVIQVNALAAEKGAVLRLTPVLAYNDGTRLQIGAPALAGTEVEAEVLDQIKGPKTVSFKKKRRKGYSRKVGARQRLTVIKINHFIAQG